MPFPKRQKRTALSPAPATQSTPSTGALPLQAYAARTAYPAQGVPLQRKIDFESSDALLGAYGETDTIESLAATLSAMHPHVDPDLIASELGRIHSEKGNWTMSQIRIAFNRLAERIPVPIPKAAVDSGIFLPERRSERLDYGFTTRTRLRARVGSIDLPEYSQTDTEHAEDRLIAAIDALIEAGDIDPKRDALIVTINNSPCEGRCTPNLVARQKKYWKFKSFTINYANPYGDADTFKGTYADLTGAKIRMNPFEPRSHFSAKDKSAMSAEQERRLEQMARRRATMDPSKMSAKGWGSGSSSPTSEAEASAATGAGDKSRSKRHNSVMDDADNYRNLIEDGSEGEFQGIRFRAVGVANDGNCFYHALAYHLGGDQNAASLRHQAAEELRVGNRAAFRRASTDREYAQRPEMEALAAAHDATLIIYQVINSWDEEPVVQRVGNGATEYHFVQSLAHIQPLERIGPKKGSKARRKAEDEED